MQKMGLNHGFNLMKLYQNFKTYFKWLKEVNDKSLNIKKLSNGVYLIKIATANKVGLKRFIKN